MIISTDFSVINWKLKEIQRTYKISENYLQFIYLQPQNKCRFLPTKPGGGGGRELTKNYFTYKSPTRDFLNIS